MFKRYLICTDLVDGLQRLTAFVPALAQAGGQQLVFTHIVPIWNEGDIPRLDEEMTGHDLAMSAFGQWMKRARRAGHAFAEVSYLHRDKPEGIWRRETLRSVLWTGIIVAPFFFGLVLNPVFYFLTLIVPVQIVRMALRDKPRTRLSWASATLTLFQKPWEAAGAMQYWIGRWRNRSSAIIEYKKD